MNDEVALAGQEDWSVVERMLPPGWEEKARELGALRRCRGFENASTLLRVLLIHLVDGCSLRETAVRASEGGLATVSDVALLKRLRNCGEWFRWMTDGLMRQWISGPPAAWWDTHWRVRAVDGSLIREPGVTGSSWRLHYSTQLPSLQCDEVQVTSREVGESLQRFQVRPGDVLLADRGFAHRAGVRHVTQAGGHVVVRMNATNLPLADKAGEPFPLLLRLSGLSAVSTGDWPARIVDAKGAVSGRVCAIRKSRHAAQRARERALSESSRKGHAVRPETLESAGYIFVFTTLPHEAWTAEAVLEMYRGRWQIELAFKRLKSLLDLGHLKKIDPDAARAWLQGKLLAAFLIEALIAAGERVFPWGYPSEESAQPLLVA